MATLPFRVLRNFPSAVTLRTAALVGATIALLGALGCAGSDATGEAAFEVRRPASTGPSKPAPAASSPSNDNANNNNGPTPHPPPSAFDAGTAHDSSSPTPPAPDQDASPPTATPGSCGSPTCGPTGGSECGCVAQASNGSHVFMACSGDQCACFSGLQASNSFNAAGVCASDADLQQAFANNCACQ